MLAKSNGNFYSISTIFWRIKDTNTLCSYKIKLITLLKKIVLLCYILINVISNNIKEISFNTLISIPLKFIWDSVKLVLWNKTFYCVSLRDKIPDFFIILPKKLSNLFIIRYNFYKCLTLFY